MSRSGTVVLALFGLVVGACATVSPSEGFTPIAFEHDRVLERLREVHALGAERRTVRAEGRLELDSPSGSGRFRQIILVERPTLLRLESQGPLGQTLSLLVTDGERYTYYDGEQLNGGSVSPFTLTDHVGLDRRLAEYLGQPSRGRPERTYRLQEQPGGSRAGGWSSPVSCRCVRIAFRQSGR